MLQDLLRENKGANLDSLIGGMSTGIIRLRGIVDDMIDVSMIDNDLLRLNYQPMQITTMMDALSYEFETAFRNRNLSLVRKEFEGNRQWIYADSVRLSQAFRNLINNAIKYTPDGGTVTIDGKTLSGFIDVTVTDTGIGIAPENQTTIFEKFGQLGRVELHSSGKTKFKGGGPGLGLPIARGILEAHGGSVWVDSPGHDETTCPGSIFHVMIPIRIESPDPNITKIFDNLGKKK